MNSASLFQRANLLSVCVLALVMLFSCEQLAQAAHVTITTQPHDTNVLAGSNATFTVVASGTAPLRYRWRLNGTNLTNGGRISGATNSTLLITAVVAGDAGGYRVAVSNSVSSVTSVVATLTVLLPPGVITPPANQTTYVGGSATFSVAATGTAPLNYRWLFGGAPLLDGSQISGSTTATLNIANVQAANFGNYQVVVTNNYGAVTSVVATLNATNRVLYVNLNNPNPAPPTPIGARRRRTFRTPLMRPFRAIGFWSPMALIPMARRRTAWSSRMPFRFQASPERRKPSLTVAARSVASIWLAARR